MTTDDAAAPAARGGPDPVEAAAPAVAPAVGPAVAPLVITPDMLTPPDAAVKRIDFERGMSYAPPLTLVIIASFLIVFIWELIVGAIYSSQAITDAGALVRDEVLGGQVWRLVTATWLHASPDHIIGNAVVLYVVGLACEHAFGATRYAVIYMASAVAGWGLSMAFHAGPSVGASGAIFGVSAAVIVFLYRYANVFFVRDKRIGFVLLAWAIYTVATGFMNPQVDNYAHIGGFLAGAACGAVLPRKIRPETTAAFPIIRA